MMALCIYLHACARGVEIPDDGLKYHQNVIDDLHFRFLPILVADPMTNERDLE